ncbi:hypothetical protein FHW69_000751 [Luteibacter sp. Sphag1AF]|uniref:hypothetical protein n=1 Tax=Luteibacter sp. Sphag1AF TaxID=2587031 RepID=UPI00161B72B5|nr:hypothetical protein [Luteibacter sp. Sphag1AF]MBB3226161.1 hypothetical protein [Luteibacter sp. Sphag1AF]
MKQRYFVLLVMAWFFGLSLSMARMDEHVAPSAALLRAAKAPVHQHDAGVLDDCVHLEAAGHSFQSDQAPAHDRDRFVERQRFC